MPTAKDSQRPHTHSWSRQDKAVYCLDCSLHFTEYIAELEQKLAQLQHPVSVGRAGTSVHAVALP
jgi:hypothetical protein